MWPKLVGAFFSGIAVGALALATALWLSGSLPMNPPADGTPVAPPSGSNSAPATPPIVPAAPPPPPEKPPEAPTEPPPGSASSLRLPHISMPLEGVDPAKIRDTFNDSRGGRKHEALDIMAPRGTPVHAVAEGNVVKLFNSKLGGITVYQFDDTATYCYYYAHLERYAPGLKEGTLLREGDVLGYVDSTGNAQPSAPHLHFAVTLLGPEKRWWEGTPVDPLPMLRCRTKVESSYSRQSRKFRF